MKLLLFIFAFFNFNQDVILKDDANLKDGSRVSIGNWHGSPNGTSDIILQKINAEGNKLWQKTFGGNSYEIGSAVIEAADGGFILVGSTSSFGTGNYDLYVIGTDENGNEIWSKTFGGLYNDYGKTITKTENGYMISGTKQNCAPDIQERHICEDLLWDVQINTEGDLLWERVIKNS